MLLETDEPGGPARSEGPEVDHRSAAGSKNRLHEGPEAAHADPALSARASPVSADDAGGFAIRPMRSRGVRCGGDVPGAPSTSGTLRRVFGDDSPQRLLCEGVYRPIGGALRCG